jgi:protein-S-isoprenylcysteine O-methyltransferase Ste14
MMRPIVRMILVIVGTAVSFGVTILGAGGFAAYFSHPPLVALALVLCVLAIAALFAGGNLSTGDREDRSNRWVLVAFAVLQVLDAYLPAYTERISFWTIDGDTIRWIGVVLFAAGGALRLSPAVLLDPRFCGLVAIEQGHTLVKSGIDGVIRHPSYLGLLVNSLGGALAFRAGVGVLLTALALVPLFARIHAEERLRRWQFGTE